MRAAGHTVNRWSGVQISHPAPSKPKKQGLFASARAQEPHRKPSSGSTQPRWRRNKCLAKNNKTGTGDKATSDPAPCSCFAITISQSLDVPRSQIASRPLEDAVRHGAAARSPPLAPYCSRSFSHSDPSLSRRDSTFVEWPQKTKLWRMLTSPARGEMRLRDSQIRRPGWSPFNDSQIGRR